MPWPETLRPALASTNRWQSDLALSWTPPAVQLRGLLRCVSDDGCGFASEVRPRLAGPTLGWRLRIQPEVAEDLLDDRPLEDGRDDLEPTAATVGAVLHGDLEHALEQAGQHHQLNPLRPVIRQYPLVAGS